MFSRFSNNSEVELLNNAEIELLENLEEMFPHY